jgi:uncharacterized protein YdaU (DUF1376 family)
MAKDPAFLFYPNDYIGGTMGMTFEEKGAYIELLMLQFNRGHMTSQMIGQTVGQIWDKIQDKFIMDESGLFYNQRLENEIHARQRFVKSRYNNLSGKNQYTKSGGHPGGHVTDRMENENENENVIINDNKDKHVKQKEKSKNDFLDQIIQAFVDVHGDYEVISPGKERMATAKLLGIYKKKYPRATSEETIAGLKSYFEDCVTIPDDWLRTNMSIPIIVSQFNKINQILKHGNKKMGATTDLQLAEIVAKHFAND